VLDFTDINLTPATGPVAVFTLKQRLKAKGWIVKSSSDGTTYSASADVITSGGAGANGLANNNAWFRIQMPTMDGVLRELTIQRGTGNTAWRVKYGANFTGGSPGATQTPSATDEQILLGGGTDALPTFGTWFGADGSYYFHAVAGDAEDGYSFFTAAYPTAGGACNHGFAMDRMIQFVPGADADPYVLVIAGGATDPYNNGNLGVYGGTAKAWHKKGLGGEGFVSVASQFYFDSSGAVGAAPAGSNANPYTTKRDLLPVLWARAASQADPDGVKGWSRLILWNAVADAGAGDSVSWGGGSKNGLQIATGVILPWKGDGTAPSKSGGSTDRAAQGFLPWRPPTWRALDPASGTALGVDYDAGRDKKVVVTFRDIPEGPDVIVVVTFTGWFEMVVYRAGAFVPFFATGSTRVGNVFTIIPLGGWPAAVQEFRAYTAVRAVE
jgi:hypothetical protein